MRENQKPEKRGGPRPNSGRKPIIPDRLIEYDVCLSLCIGRSHAKRLLAESSPESLLGAKRVRDLRKWGSQADGPAYLAHHRRSYEEMRERWGWRA